MNGNMFMSWVLRSPFHSLLSNGMMLITVTGRKTGRKYTLPVGYYPDYGYLWIITSRNRTWWRNLESGAQVELLLKNKKVCGIGEAELDENAIEARINEYLCHVPQAAKPLGIHMVNGVPTHEDVVRVAKERLFVKIKIQSTMN